jgi:transcriptional regulator with GAF, ATPase, and Fis domain
VRQAFAPIAGLGGGAIAGAREIPDDPRSESRIENATGADRHPRGSAMEELTLAPEITSIDAESVAGVLSEVAEIASETLELQDVFERVANSIRQIIPFENMGVVRIVDGERAVLHASTVPCRADQVKCTGPIPLTSWSPRMRPRPGPNPRIEDARLEFDPAYPFDAKALEGGVRSGMWEPFRSTDSLRGGVWLAATRPHAFTDEHQAALRPIAALLGSAVEHWRIWDSERRRRERLDKVETLLVPLAGSLDVAAVFQELSDGMKQILPHDLMSWTELDLQSKAIRVSAVAGEADIAPPTFIVALSQEELDRRIDFEIVHDIPAEIAPETERQRLILSLGMRSWLRVPLLLSGEVKGSLSFFHREPSRYDWEDAEVARRLADRIALVLSHRQLAEEARIATESRERAERLEATVETLSRQLESRDRSRVVGVSPSWKDTLRQVGRVASSDTTVLITGESGTGKEVISSLIHQGSDRAGKPFVAINCAALPEQLLESELFGHEKGAFTGAIATKIGRIEQAAGGTLFLDEIAEMSPLVQAKLLRVLEQREFQRVGGSRTLQADVRVITATNRDLAASMERGAFRLDLYYRLNVFQIHITPLRERPEDILPLAEVFLHDLGRTMARPAAGISRDARDWLLAYHWPGNVRELRNAIERAILLCDGGLITRDHLPTPLVRPGPIRDTPAVASETPAPASHNGSSPHGAAPSDGLNLGTMERGLLEKALSQSKGNKSKAARLLGLTRAQLYWRMEKHGLR